MRRLLFASLLTVFSAANAEEIWSRPEPGQTRERPVPVEVAPQSAPVPRSIPEPEKKEALCELGLTVGPPTLVNINLGYWGPGDAPFVARVSGMYYGETRGIQVDAGYVFSRRRLLKQYLAVTFISYQLTTEVYSFRAHRDLGTYKDLFTGLGPSYGLNWDGLSFQVGVAFGQDVNYHSELVPQLTFQIGYTVLW